MTEAPEGVVTRCMRQGWAGIMTPSETRPVQYQAVACVQIVCFKAPLAVCVSLRMRSVPAVCMSARRGLGSVVQPPAAIESWHMVAKVPDVPCTLQSTQLCNHVGG